MTDLVKQCKHDITEREVAVADGYCPLCAADRIEQLEAFVQYIANMGGALGEKARTILAKHQSQDPLENSESPSLTTPHGQE